jgi:hypothetical protein
MGGGVGVGVSVGTGVGDGNPVGADVAPLMGVGNPPGCGVVLGVAAGGLVRMGAGGFTCARVVANDAIEHAAAKAAPQSEAGFTRYAILASLRLTAEASNVL